MSDAPPLVFGNRFFFPDHSATSQLLTDLTLELAIRGHRIEVVTGEQGYDGQSLKNAPTPHRAVVVNRVPSTTFGRGGYGRAFDYLSFICRSRTAFRRVIGAGSLVVVKTDPPMFSAFLAGLIKSRGARLINWIQDLYPEIATAAGVPMASRLPAAPLRMLRNRSLRMATATVVVGDRMAERVRSMGVTDPNSIHVIHNWADGDQIVPMPKHVNALRAQWGLEDRFVVGYSGNLGVVHEAKTILDAIRLMQSHKKIVFLFIGGGSGMRALRHSVEHEALPNVRFLPYQERAALSESLGVPDVHLCSLRPEFEGLVVPSKIFGIMAAARPCIFVGEPDGEVSRLLRRGTAGVTVDAGDAHRLADEILRLFSDSGLAEGLGSAARAYFNNNFDRPIALSKWQKLLAHYG